MIWRGVGRLFGLPGWNRKSSSAEVEEEMRLHVDLRVEELMRGGWTREEAVNEAWRKFGGEGEARRVLRRTADRRDRKMNRREGIATVGHDVAFGARQLRRNPGFTAAAVVTLALGIGANTAIFSFVDGLLLRPPQHVSEPERLARIYTSDFSGPLYGSSSFPDYIDFAEGLEDAAELAASGGTETTVEAGEQVELWRVGYATPNYFRVLGVEPAAGRLFASGESTAAEPVVVLSHDSWQGVFGEDPTVVGRVVRLSGQPMTVVGVAPRGFAGPGGRRPTVDAWVPIGMAPALRPSSGESFLERRGSRGLSIVGRLAPGATVEAVASRLESVGAALFAGHPGEWTDVRESPRQVTVVAGRESWISPTQHGAISSFAALLMGLVVLVLLIACVNVANLLLARATRRRQEIGVRLAIGASRGRLVRQLLTESILLAGFGGAFGLLFAASTISVLRRAGDALPLNVAFDVRLDLRVLVFTLAVTIVAGIVFGLLPAILTARRDPAPTLKNEGGSGGREGNALRSGLVAIQVAASVVLLICASLLVRSLGNAVDTELGFEPSDILLVPVTVVPPAYTPETGLVFYRSALERVGSLPGVEAVALGSQVPLSGRYSRRRVWPEGYQPGRGEDMEVDFARVTSEYLDLLRIPVRGRSIADTDREGGAGVVVVNQAFADRFWPGEDPLAKRVGFGGSDGPTAEVVGVTPPGKLRGLDEAPRPNIYMPLEQDFSGNVMMFVRAAGDPAALGPGIRSELRSLDSGVPVPNTFTFESVIAEQVLPLRMAGLLFSGFGAIALAIAAIGLYGILAYAVGQRWREIGIRSALGATGKRLAIAIVGRAMVLVGVGAGVGLVAGLLVAPLLESLLFGVSGTDAWVMAGVVGLLGAISLIASFIPARRAAAVDPIIALREG